MLQLASDSTMAADGVRKGLDGVIADYTAVSTVGKHEAGLTYRGYAIEDLAEFCEFEEVAHLLIRGALPDVATLASFKQRLAAMRALPPSVLTALEVIPKDAHPMDVLRTACSVLGCVEPETAEVGKGTASTCERLIPVFASSLCYWYHFANSGKRITINVAPEDNLSVAFLKMLRNDGRQPSATHVKVINAAFILYAEHDFNASTFSARTVASTLSDSYSCVVAAIGALRGPLHGGANEAVMYLLEDVRSVEAGEKKVRELMAQKQLVMGFGHRIYKNGDPRNAVFKKLSKELADGPGGDKILFDVSAHIEALMETEKKMYPNADFFAASAYHQAGIPTPFFTPLFVIARTAGWCAHISEQLGGNGKNKIIRPASSYNGPSKQPFVQIAARSRSKL